MKVFVVFFILLLLGCVSKKEKEEVEESKYRSPKLGKYVYQDSQNTLHIKSPCRLGMEMWSSNGGVFYKSITYIDTIELVYDDIISMCPLCTDDKSYEQLERIVKRNNNRNLDW